MSVEFYPLSNPGGIWCGVVATENEGEIAALRELAAKTSVIQELSEAEYLERTKKKARKLPPLSVLATPPPQQLSMEGRNAVLVADPVAKGLGSASQSIEKTGAPVNSIDDVIVIAKVTPPETARARMVKGRKRG